MSEVVDSNDSRDAHLENSTDQATTNGWTDSGTTPKSEGMTSDPAPPDGAKDQIMADPADADADGDSEAETLIQSPEKQRATADNTSVAGSANISTSKEEDSTSGAAATEADMKSRKRKRGIDEGQDESTFSTSSRRSSPLSSPRLLPHSADSDSEISSTLTPQISRPTRRKLENNTAESDDGGEKTAKPQTRRRRPSDILPPISKQRAKNNNAGVDPGLSERRETRSATYPRHSSHERSPSPRPPNRREHRRGASTQMLLGDVERKKRGRPPAIHTRRGGSADPPIQTASSDESESPRQSRPSLHKFSSADHDTMSPAKAMIRKNRDRNGRTLLSRACNNNDLEGAKARLAERPEDLNEADNAGNTPLQIAALEGFAKIVQFLLKNKCDVNTRNIDKETPLIDAVENGHVEVIRLLLQYGANPRLGNAKGDEPYELAPQDDENYEEIRTLLGEAKENPISRRVSIDHTEAVRDEHSSRAASAASPRDSPPLTGPRSPPPFASRRRTGRGEPTRNDLLWQANTQENLTRLAAKGDVQGVANILNILQKAQTESLIAAAKAGHEEVLQYLLGMGDPEPDPEPIRNIKVGHNTPMLAAIGRGHPEVVKLLVEQSGFNPTRKLLKGKTYFEVSAERKGEQWQQEFEVLKTAYDKYAAGKTRKTTSPRVTRDSDKSKGRILRRSQSPVSSKLRNSTSPTLTHKSLDSGSVDGPERRKHHGARNETGDSSVAVSSDQDQTVNAPRKAQLKRRSQSDLPQSSHLDPEGNQRRRRLVTGKEHRRRQSIVEEGSSDEESPKLLVKPEIQANTAVKRTRETMSPEPTAAADGGTGRSSVKKRRTAIESSREEPRIGLKRGGELTPTPPRERRADKPPSEENDSRRSKRQRSDQPGRKGPGQKMDVDTGVEEVPMDPVKVVDPVAPQAETSDPIKVEPIDAGPSEAELELIRQAEARQIEAAKRLEEERIAAQQSADKAAEEQRIVEENARRKKAEEEAALKKREEDERHERIKRDLEERKRRQEEQLRQQRLELERRRREALPIVLNRSALMIDNNDPAVRSQAWLSKFLPLFTVRTAQLDADAAPASEEELWIPNFQVAGLLATKDLNLRNYTSLEKRAVTLLQRQCLWRVSRVMLSYEYEMNGMNTSIQKAIQKEEEEKPKFFAMEELFWVKLSDFEDQVFRHPHLVGLALKKQAISLRVIGLHTPTAQSPQPNGIPQPSPKLTNGISPRMSPTVYANGYGR